MSSSLAEEFLIPEIIIEAGQELTGSRLEEMQTFKSEKVSKDKFSDSTRKSIADLVKDQVGVDTQVYCANCGAKRLTINGLRGEHTSILVDGIPLHSAVSSFYGVDTVPINGLKDVLVMRGAGASLSNPEAIGGTLNLITIDPLDFQNKFQTSLGINDQGNGQSQNHNFLLGTQNKEKSLGIVFGGQYYKDETWDEDNNLVAELPQREGKSFMIKPRLKKGKLDTSVRLGYSDLTILGGFVDPVKPTNVRGIEANEADFINGSVDERYIGDPQKITDWINLTRYEAALNTTLYISGQTTIDIKGGFARQEQKAIYQHGFDYANIDNLFVGDVSTSTTLGKGLVAKAGLFIKDQRMRSESQTLFEQYAPTDSRDIKKDSFDFLSTAAYTEITKLYKNLEINLAARADKISMNWLELSNEIDEWVLAPRLQVSHFINDHLTQRFSYGLGYRAPLTFFESQHGNNESGYEVDITELEKAHSLVYSLSYNTPTYYVTGGAHYTHLRNMAYGFEEFNQPIRYRSSEGDYDVLVADLLVGYKPKDWWLIEGTVEFFNYQEGYKRKLPTAAIEERIQLRSSIDQEKWSHSINVQIIPGRDLSAYGSYNDHYIRRNQSSEPILDTTLPRKRLRSPLFATVDTSFSYKLNPSSIFSLSINNVFDYTQTSSGDSPSTWHWHFNHAHYDGLHTWGPNAGRQFILGYEHRF